MTTLVSINGIMQSPYEYEELNHHLVFNEAPSAGANINVNIDGNIMTYLGNGTNRIFTVPFELREEIKFKNFAHEVWKHRDNPTVNDQIEKLKIVMELIK